MPCNLRGKANIAFSGGEKKSKQEFISIDPLRIEEKLTYIFLSPLDVQKLERHCGSVWML